MLKVFFFAFIISTIPQITFSGEPCNCETDYSDFKTDNCDQKIESEGTSHWQCQDGSYSFSQPSSNGDGIEWRGQTYNTEGKCGQTTFANIVKNICGIYADPATVEYSYMHALHRPPQGYEWFLGPLMFLLKRDAVDKFPGTLPGSLVDALNSFFSDYPNLCGHGKWEKFRASSGDNFIKNIAHGLQLRGKEKPFKITRLNGQVVERSPVAVLIKFPNKDSLHWITVVDYEVAPENGCVLTYNAEGVQYKTSCLQMQEWSYNITRNYGAVASGLTYVTVQLTLD